MCHSEYQGRKDCVPIPCPLKDLGEKPPVPMIVLIFARIIIWTGDVKNIFKGASNRYTLLIHACYTMGYHATIVRYVAQGGIARFCQRKSKCQGNIAPLWGVVSLMRRQRAHNMGCRSNGIAIVVEWKYGVATSPTATEPQNPKSAF